MSQGIVQKQQLINANPVATASLLFTSLVFIRRMCLSVFTVAILSGCIGSENWVGRAYPEPSDNLLPQDRVIFWEEQLAETPKDAHLLVRLWEERNAATHYFLDLGNRYDAAADYQQALASYQQGLLINNGSPELSAALQRSQGKVKALGLLSKAKELEQDRGNLNQVQELLQEAAIADPANDDIAAMGSRIQQRLDNYQRKAQPTIDLNFKQIEFKQAMAFVGKSFGINVIFDQSAKDPQITMNVDDLAFKDAIKLLTSTTKHSFKVVSPDTLLIFADSKDRHKHFDDLQIRSFYLKTIEAKDMASLIKGVLGISKVTINEANNSLIVYENPETIANIARIVKEHDLLPGEVILEVEILEVNLSEADRIGLDYGAYQISANTTDIPITGSLRDAIQANTTVNIPSLNFNIFKQRVGSKLLANPSIRVLDGEKAKIHIGDRVPLRKSTIQDATGQTRTTFEYQEIGIRFNVEASLNASDYVSIIVSLEVSSLGENLGTATEQAFRIGTRNADSTMLVRDGETAIMGGLIREEGRTSRNNVRGLNFLGALSGNKDESSGRTDLLLAITPRVIRPSSSGQASAISKGRYGPSKSPLDALRLKPKARQNLDGNGVVGIEQAPSIIFSDRLQDDENLATIESNGSAEPLVQKPLVQQAIGEKESIVLKTQQAEYAVSEGELFTLSIDANLWNSLAYSRFSLIYNNNIIAYEGAQWRTEEPVLLDSAFQSGSNSVEFTLDLSNEAITDLEGTLDIQFRAKRSGNSFIVLRMDDAKGRNNESVKIQTQNAKVQVK